MSSEKNKNPLKNARGRGTESRAVSRFDRLQVETDLSNYGFVEEDDFSTIKTEFFNDSSRTIVNENESPDIPFRYSLNPYRGCEHGCAYCYARPTHEYLGLSAGVDFESKIFVKKDAPELLRKKLMSKSWEPETIMISGVTDCYQPAERQFQITRKVLEVLLEFKNPVGMITKNELITRDLDLLSEMAKFQLAAVFVSVTTLDADLARKLEPRTSSPEGRLRAIEKLAKAGVQVGVNVAPVIPGLTDQEMPAILEAAKNAGARWAGFVPVRLPHSVKMIFEDWLEKHYPDRKDRVLNAIRSLRGGELYDSNFATRMTGTGVKADQMRHLFELFKRKHDYGREQLVLSTEHFKQPEDLSKPKQFTFDV